MERSRDKKPLAEHDRPMPRRRLRREGCRVPDMSVHPKHARTDHDVLDVIRQRWSPRAFDATRDVARERSAAALRGRALGAVVAATSSRGGSSSSTRRRSVGAHRRAARVAHGEESGLGGRGAGAGARRASARRSSATKRANSHAWYDAGQAVALPDAAGDVAWACRSRQMEGFDAEQRARGLRRARAVRARRRDRDRLRRRSGDARRSRSTATPSKPRARDVRRRVRVRRTWGQRSASDRRARSVRP